MKLYNSLTGKMENFSPLKKDEVSLYVCGITPYDATHLGHLKTYAIFDVLNRFLNFSGFKVNYIQNITDVDPPLFRRANETGISYEKIAKVETEKFVKNLDELNIIRPTKFVKVSEEMNEIILSIKDLISENYAYVSDNVYFDSGKIKDFGKLSKLNKIEMLENPTFVKTEINSKNKKNSLDFLLWRITDESPNWESPWGNGQPGWHIECSSIINSYFGKQIDIHGGGSDLIFPHHECEIVQSEILNENNLANYWVHVAPLNLNGEKMSKSMGNLIFVDDVLKKDSPEALRLYLASVHYRKPLEYNESKLERFEKLNEFLNRPKKISNEKGKINYHKKIISPLGDDLNTPIALNEFINYTDEINKRGFTSYEESENYSEIKSLFGI